MLPRVRMLLILLLLIFSVGYLTACASRPPTDSSDPYESYNRKVYAFNMFFDKTVFRPVAKTYEFITPSFARGRVTSFFGTVDILNTVANDFLQFKMKFAVMDMWRFVINATLGLGGLFDVSSKIGFPDHHEDFGLTLAQWGAKHSNYMMAPFLGPSTLRDTFGTTADLLAENYAIWNWVKPSWVKWSVYGLNLVNTRANLLVADPLLAGAFDPYVFLRNAYMQRRQQQIDDNTLSFEDLYAEQIKERHV